MAEEDPLDDSEEAERGRMLSYVDLLANADQEGRSAYELDAGEVDQLLLLVGDHADRPAIWANNLLCTAYDNCRPPFTGGDDLPKQMDRNKPDKASDVAPALLTAHPNPASAWVALEHHVPGNTKALSLVVRDMTGKAMHSITAGGAQGQSLWDTRNVRPGAYTVELHDGDRILGTVRVVIQR